MRAKQHLEEVLQQVVADMGFEWPEKATLEPPKDKKFGDMAANVAMMLAKQAKKNPRQIAEDIREAALEKSDYIEKIDVAGPGFLNFTLTPGFWRENVALVLRAGDDYGRIDMGGGRKIQVEYVSANPTGPLHIGHGRGAALGDALARILRRTGFEVETEYYVNDAGRQMRILGASIYVRLKQSQGAKVGLPEDCYKGDYVKDLALEALEHYGPELLEKPEPEALDMCREFGMNKILAGIKRDLEDFGVEHQVWFSERSLVDNGDVEKTFERLKANGLAFEKDGALWFETTRFGDDKDRVLRKSSGDLTYFASDIAYHDNKYHRGFDQVVDIWGADHHGYIPRMKAAVQALGRERDDLEIILVQLVNLLRGGDQVAMSTRAGEFETLSDVVSEVGADAARFIFLSRKSDSPLDFDLELVKQQTMDNPVYYVQYAHARICSLFRKAAERDIAIPEMSPELMDRLDTPEDMLLLGLLDQFPDFMASAARNLSPHFVSMYLQDLAGKLHRYYTVNKVLAADDEAVRDARMLLLSAVAQVLKNGLEALGVSAPQSM